MTVCFSILYFWKLLCSWNCFVDTCFYYTATFFFFFLQGRWNFSLAWINRTLINRLGFLITPTFKSSLRKGKMPQRGCHDWVSARWFWEIRKSLLGFQLGVPAWSSAVSAEPPNSGPKLETQRSLELLNHIAGRHVGWWSEHPSSSSLKSNTWSFDLGQVLNLSRSSFHTSTVGTPLHQRAAERFKWDNVYKSFNPVANKLLQKWRLS